MIKQITVKKINKNEPWIIKKKASGISIIELINLLINSLLLAEELIMNLDQH